MLRLSWTAIGHDVGLLLHIPGIMAITGLVMAVIFQEWFALPGFFLTVILSIAVGQILYRCCHAGEEPRSPQSFIVVALAWLFIVVMEALPFYLAAQLGSDLSETSLAFKEPLNALFESMSGFTSTGLTMTQDASALPYSLQWWRTLSEWIGGVGVIVLALALIDKSEKEYALYTAEARASQLGPNVTSTVRRIWMIFIAYTVFAIGAFWLTGMPAWEALNHGMTGIATGGFAVTSNSFQGYGSGVKIVTIAVMLLGAVSFAVHHHILARFDLKSAWRHSQLWTFVVLIALGLFTLSLSKVVKSDTVSLLDQVFQWASALGTCGFNSVALDVWTQSSLSVLTVGMVIGGMAGSTTGGLKLSRMTWLAKALWWRLRNLWLAEHQTENYTYDGETISEEQAMRQVSSAALIAFLWMMTLTAGTLLLFSQVGDRYSLHEVLFETTSALGSVGLSIGITATYLSAMAKLTLMVLMWMGRLEILAVVILCASPVMTLISRRRAS